MLPDRTGNSCMIHPTTKISIAGSPYNIAVNEMLYSRAMLQCSKPFLFLLGSFFSNSEIDAMQQHSEQGDRTGLSSGWRKN